MRILENLEPKAVFAIFEDLCAIPHGSENTKAVSDYCAAFARDHGLACYQDDLDNVVIKKPASPGYEHAQPVILQGHMDMVCEKEPDCGKDMDREGLDLFVDGDLVGARGTTLGGDDGIAVAMILAILEDATLPHPPLEAVFTVDEEIGMQGAEGLDASVLRGRRMLNLDSEDEGILTVSCAGGNRTTCTLPVEREPFSGACCTVTIGGLIGGHSGNEIDKGRASSNVLTGRVLDELARKTQMRLVRVDGGDKDNAIPRMTKAMVAVQDEAAAAQITAQMDAVFKKEYECTDPNVFVCFERGEDEWLPMDAPSTQRVIGLLLCAPDGVQANDPNLPGLVETSLNLGILQTAEDHFSATFCVRSSVGTRKAMVTARLRRLAEMLGGSAAVTGDYPAWEYRKDSPLRDIMTQVFRERYHREMTVESIHAGLECGLFSDKLPGLDCVSFGPDLEEIHTPRERLHIASVARVWAYTLEVLKRCK